jgi:hypothetical protein
MTEDLVAFLRARLDEDEQTARAAGGVDWLRPEYPGETVAIFDSTGEPVVYDEGWPSEGQLTHIAEHDPERVLAEVDAKRRTLVRCEEALLAASPMLVHFAKQTLWEMARPYREHPDYRPEWAPGI